MSELLLQSAVQQSMDRVTMTDFNKEKHARYFLEFLKVLPPPYVGLDTSKLNVIYFVVLALDMLGKLDMLEDQRSAIIDHIYKSQIFVSTSSPLIGHAGFIGSAYLGNEAGSCIDLDCEGPVSYNKRLMQGHIAMTYTALATLIALGEDLSALNKAQLTAGLKRLQQDNGSFSATLEANEADMRFLYCACAISAMLNDWSGVDVPKAIEFIAKCRTYEGAFGLIPESEAHGGSTYCATASLILMRDCLGVDISAIDTVSLTRWCLMKQVGGYCGRTCKTPDTCYSFWIGATLHLLGSFDLTDFPSTESFLMMECQCTSGGFSKVPGVYSDVLHSFYSLSWLSMAGLHGVASIDPRLAILKEKSVRHFSNSKHYSY